MCVGRDNASYGRSIQIATYNSLLKRYDQLSNEIAPSSVRWTDTRYVAWRWLLCEREYKHCLIFAFCCWWLHWFRWMLCMNGKAIDCGGSPFCLSTMGTNLGVNRVINNVQKINGTKNNTGSVRELYCVSLCVRRDVILFFAHGKCWFPPKKLPWWKNKMATLTH